MTKKRMFLRTFFVLICIALNVGGKYLALKLELPVYLDALGTILAAYALGPVCGGIVGATTNLTFGAFFPDAYIYVIVSICIGVIAGFLGRRGMLETYLSTASAAMILTIVAVLLSVPLNIALFGGMTGNVWGDGVIEYLLSIGWYRPICYSIGQFYVDFLDKTLCVFVLSFLVHIQRLAAKKLRGEKLPEKGGYFFVFLAILVSGAALSTPLETMAAQVAEDDRFGSFVQTVYNAEDGIPGGAVTDIEQTRDGVLWLGTYGGLYQYDGTHFTWMDRFTSVRNVNCLYTDVEGRLWIGTNDGGLSICTDNEIVNILDENSGLPSNSVRCITRSQDGSYYVGTSDALAIVSIVNGVHITDIIEDVFYAVSCASDSKGNVVAVDSAGNLHLLRDGKLVSSKNNSSIGAYTSVCFDEENNLYVSYSIGRVEKYTLEDGELKWKRTYRCNGLNGIKSLRVYDDIIYICADNGAGYMDERGEFFLFQTGNFSSSIEHMLIDYQGNLWFSSTRLGLLKYCESIFTEISERSGLEKKVVNSTIFWNGHYYFGTDSGLDCVNQGLNATENSLTNALADIRVRCLMEDNEGNLWISTAGKGVWMVNPSLAITIYDSTSGVCGNKIRSTLQLSDGTIAVAGDLGITFIKDGQVQSVISREEGLSNTRVLCMIQTVDGSIYAGTDGNGVAVIENGKIVRTIKREDGLSSDVVLRIVKASYRSGYYVVQSNGVSFIPHYGDITVLNNMPYYNNYDILCRKGKLWILGSAGIYIVDEKQLLSGDAVDYELFDARRGLRQSLTPNAWNYVDDEGRLFMSGDSGVIGVNTDDYALARNSYRICIGSMKVDDLQVRADSDEEILVSKEASRIEINPMVINYSVNNPFVSVYLEGYDEKPMVMQQSDLSSLTYMNLPSGEYTFHLAVLDNYKRHVLEEVTYRIVKEANRYDHLYFKVYMVLVLTLLVVYLTSFFVRNTVQRSLELQKKQIENLKLLQAAEAANTASKIKSDFLAQMSHEIRTPINAVLGMNELILRETKDSTIYDYATNIDAAGHNLLTLINGILDFSKIEDGKMEIIPVQYDTAKLVNNIEHSITERARAKNLEFIVHVDEKLPEKMLGDDVRITQIISNLLTNAVKYTNAGSVTLIVREHAVAEDVISLYVEVADTGIGIKEEDLPALFESFTRLEEKRNRHIEGTGLGMSIVTKLLAMMGSELQVKSVYGEGSVFSFILDQKIVSDKPIGDYHERIRDKMNNQRHDVSFKAPEARVLVTDDNGMNLKVAEGLLRVFGINCDCACSGEETLEILKEKRYDLILIDHMMPQMDGIETLDEIRRRELCDEQTKIVVLTANAIVGAKESYQAAGFDGYLSKPIDMGMLEQILRDFLPDHLIEDVPKTQEISSAENHMDHLANEKMEQEISQEEALLSVPGFSAEEVQRIREICPKLNLVTGMTYCMNMREFYESMLKEYLDNDKEEVLIQYFDSMDIENYRIVIHALKSTSLTIGAEELSEQAKALEMAAKSDDIDFIKANHAKTLAAYAELKEQLRTILS
ncbi:MAG: ATP-binding protein [bacterium]|nr:ATP-binding protein [bacterium]